MTRLGEAYLGGQGIRPRQIQRDVKLETMKQVAHFEFAIGSEHVRQLSRVVSFQRQGMDNLLQDVQAWSFAVGQLRRRGGEVRNSARRKNPIAEVDPDVPVRVLYVPPETTEQHSAFSAAKSAWDDLDVKAYAAGDEASIAHEAESLLASAP
ncbi:hypothetical protein HMPREF0063_11501 [Aeromicrobium marinum DSM 15272]|uniref:Uncharacterized protein n=1 Tax=Aeromicrobium marinum DSM 15272 TaxID=585531 RepID=E2SBU2_9ACTN|nr:hypothetical protein HMPREF0063_11501 [Aeromicrobium marinum DSM 15272]